MRKKKVDITQDELLAILEQSGRSNFTKRRLTQLTGEGLLPQLKRTALAGSNRPVYVWGQEVIEQAKYLYDLIERGEARDRIFLTLWLAGNDVPFAPFLAHWIQPIDTLLHNLTGGEQDPDDALDHISSSLVQYAEPNWKFSPKSDEVIREVGRNGWRELMEFFFDMLAVPTYEPDETSYENLLRTLQRLNSIAKSEADPEETLSWLLSLREVFTLPRYRDTLINATIEEWAQARDDYLTLCQLLRHLAALFPQRNAHLTDEMRQTLFLNWGSKLPPFLLAVRHAGYGDWIDETVVGFMNDVHDVLTDPGLRERLALM